MKKLILAPVLALALLFTALTGTAFAGGGHRTFTEYETTVCWEMDSPNMADPASIEWPQTRVATCPADTERCTGTKYQQDTYWIRDQSDEDYLAGLTTLGSPDDDAQLEPHNYSVIYVASNPDLCVTPPPPVETCETNPNLCPPPVVHKRAAFNVRSYCNGVFLEGKRNANVVKTKIRPGTFRFVGTGKVVDGVQALFDNGTDTRTIVRHVKRAGCGSHSS